ncbi:exopolysaccharide production protein, putative [Nitratidesulfovibrio vulgaris str. Hildenborough]|uniref:Exopolysaccharide production protein, putative n=2 Tax=Nitratidesulfovibrio vulgaris TaxID=881 RepID=Q72EA8_NITV2|nr:exopolysaccharide production protein, putative [Nitratidesulfovibrio vulgaris str. Hildenborough]
MRSVALKLSSYQETSVRIGRMHFSSRFTMEGLFLGMLTGLFVMLGLNRGVYPFMWGAGITALFLLYRVCRRSEMACFAQVALLPFVFIGYVMLSPSDFGADFPLGGMYLCAYLTGLSLGFVRPRAMWIPLLGLALVIVLSLPVGWLVVGRETLFFHGRLKLFFHHPAVLATLALWCALYLVTSWRDIPGQWRWVWSCAAGACVVFAVLSMARAPLFGFMAAVTVLFVLRWKRVGLRFLVACMVLVGIGVVLLSAGERGRLVASIAAPLEQPSLISRKPIWEAAWSGFVESPLLGNTLSAFHSHYEEYITTNEERLHAQYPVVERSLRYPHSTYLAVLFGFGLFGTLLLVVAFVPAVCLSLRANDLFLPCVVVFMLVYGTVEASLHRKDGAMELFFPLGVACGRLVSRERREPDVIAKAQTLPS